MNTIKELARMLWHNIKVLWLNLRHPLSKEQREKDMDDLVNPKQ